VGLRVIYGKQFNSRKEAAAFVSAQSLIPKLNGRYLNVEGDIVDPEIYFVYESETVGFSVRIKSQQTNIKLTVPVEFQDVLKQSKAERSVATLDVDYYAHGTTPVTSFDGPALIEAWLHLIRRDIGKLF
jgi:hypothetical protein